MRILRFCCHLNSHLYFVCHLPTVQVVYFQQQVHLSAVQRNLLLTQSDDLVLTADSSSIYQMQFHKFMKNS